MWQSLLRYSLVGTDRAVIPPDLLERLQELGVYIVADPAKILLDGLALYAPMRKAAFPMVHYSGALPPSVTEEGVRYCGEGALNCLWAMLLGPQIAVLPEFIRILKAQQCCLPPASLSMIFDTCMKTEGLWEQVQSVIGPNGWWLLQRNPDWQKLWIQEPSRVWENGAFQERQTALQQMRVNDPSAALALLEASWNKEDPRHKIAFLKILETGLSAADQSFLERCTSDSRKEIRQVALGLLLKIPSEHLSASLFETALGFVRISTSRGNKRLEVIFPEDLDVLADRFGFRSDAKKSSGGWRAGILTQFISLIPPRRWASQYDLTPEEWLELLIESDWESLWLNGLVQAAIWQEDMRWLEALARYFLDHALPEELVGETGKQLARALPEPLWTQLLLGYLQKRKLDFALFPGLLFKAGDQRWSKDLSLAFVKALQVHLQKGTLSSRYHLEAGQILMQLALRCHPSLHDTVADHLRGISEAHYVNMIIEDALRLLAFRKTMYEQTVVK